MMVIETVTMESTRIRDFAIAIPSVTTIVSTMVSASRMRRSLDVIAMERQASDVNWFLITFKIMLHITTINNRAIRLSVTAQHHIQSRKSATKVRDQ